MTDWIYPANPGTESWGYRTAEGVSIPPRELFAGKHPDVLGPGNRVQTWYLPRLRREFHAGDVVWVRQSETGGLLVGAGVVLTEPWPGEDGGIYFEVDFWNPESRDLAAVPFDLAVESVPQSARTAKDSERAQVLARFPDGVTVDDDTRARLRRRQDVAGRQGLTVFREKLIDAYGGRCAITGDDVIDALHAAYIDPYTETGRELVVNGLLLRADVRDLFDQGRIWVDVDGKVRMHTSLRSSGYKQYSGKKLRLPKDENKRPGTTRLARHRRVIAGQSA
ncbi:HNH endonuclease [Promicromonospora umidemergens]|uniref:HNH nuclease domain-containing protein n=1 Tax=Promicromonospora umidemergens TaxID=629679 RepID=A0ABP8WJ83_9MICO|nr:HNH endonuclease [Promicromonospora umidemergens]MCP2284080.1 HNH endonuclease [Promicromonospora umidemergens]